LAAAKFLVLDKLTELDAAKTLCEQNQNILSTYADTLEEYDEINGQYNRYSSSFLTEGEILCDRMEVLSMLEETIFAQGTMDSVTITDNTVLVNFKGINLEETAVLTQRLEGYDIVKAVDVNAASLNSSAGNYSVRMVIALTESTGGDQ